MYILDAELFATIEEDADEDFKTGPSFWRRDAPAPSLSPAIALICTLVNVPYSNQIQSQLMFYSCTGVMAAVWLESRAECRT